MVIKRVQSNQSSTKIEGNFDINQKLNVNKVWWKKSAYLQKFVTNKKSTILIQSPPNLAKKTTSLLIILAKFRGGWIKVDQFLEVCTFFPQEFT